MKNILSIDRILCLMKNELVRNRKLYLVSLCVMAAMFALAALTGPNGFIGVQNGFQSFLVLITIILPLVIYNNLFHTVKGVCYTLLPASQEEKFLVNFLHCTVVFPFFVLLTGLVLSCLGALFTGDARCIWNVWSLFCSHHSDIAWLVDDYDQISRYSVKLGFFDSRFWSTLVLQSFCLWGVYFFKEKKTGKLIATAACAVVGLAIVGGIMAHSYLGYWHQYANFDDEAVIISATRFATIINIFRAFFVPFGLWTWAFFKGRKQQF